MPGRDLAGSIPYKDKAALFRCTKTRYFTNKVHGVFGARERFSF